MANQFNLNKFNTLMSQASDAILCNSECKQKREAEKLKQNYENAQTTLASASSQVQVAQKNYVTFTQGEPAYNELLDSQLQEKAQLIADKFNENFNEESTKINSQINTYDGLLINFNNIFDLFRKYKRENIELYKELKEESNDVLTNERKTYYQDQNIDSLKFYYHYFLLTVYVIIVICFAAFSLIYPSQTSWIIKLALLVVFIALPFFSTWILGRIIYLVYTVYDMLPKNVYNQKNY
jgi:uncharacterized membrane protein